MVATFNSETFYPSFILPREQGFSCQTRPQDVSEEADTALTAEQREEAITRAGELMERRYKAFDDTGCLAALGDAHAALLLMKKLIAGRDRDTVLRMEIRKGLI